MSISQTQISSVSASNVQARRLSLADFFALTKPTISLLVVVTAVPTMFLAAAPHVPTTSLVLWTLLGTWLASASAAVLNQLVDMDVDAYMVRTKKRPLPSGRMSQWIALTFAMSLGLLSVLVLGFKATPLAALVAVCANVFYVLIYTVILKRRTVQNIVIGGAAGAVGPLIGWTAVQGSSIGWPAWVLFAIICLWTPPHFWALALKYKDDYARASIPMLPVVKGIPATQRQIFWYSVTLIPAVVALFFSGTVGFIYLIPSLALTVYFVYLTWKLLQNYSEAAAMKVFHFSCFYLFGIFGALTFDALIRYL